MTDTKTVTHKLKKSIKTAAGDTIKELKINPPSHVVIDKVGFPFTLIQGGQDIKPDRCREYLADMTGVMEPDLKKLSPGDLLELSMVVVGFFE